MESKMSANVPELQAGIVLTFAASALPPLKPPAWLWGVVATAVLGLLVGFYFVVRAIERQGEQRRLAVLAHADATWRCKALLGRVSRASCLMELNPPSGTDSVVQANAEVGAR